jgi:hypothetical protein
MLAYTLKDILSLVPEALPLVKEAHVDQDMPLDNRASCIATALAVKYNEQVNYKPVDVFKLDKVAKALELHGVTDLVDDLSKKMVKAAHERTISEGLERNRKNEYMMKEAAFAGESTGFGLGPLRLVGQAETLYKEAQAQGFEPSEDVVRYSGHGFLNKEAAIQSLAARYQASKDSNFVKIASAINRLDTTTLKAETVQDICKTITEMDKEAGIAALGFDFYREAILVKAAAVASALSVKLCGKDCPYEKVLRVHHLLGDYVGKEVPTAMSRGHIEGKHALERLHPDLQKVVMDVVQNA